MPAEAFPVGARQSLPVPWRCLIAVPLTLHVLFLPGGCARSRALRDLSPMYEMHTSDEHADFGVAYERSGDLEAAARQYQWAVKLDPENAIAWTNLGNVRAQRGQWTEAREAYETAMALDPRYGPAVNNLACTYLDDIPADPARAEAILRAHAGLVEEIYRDVIQETLERAREMAAP